jgi:hypothetical protein
MLPILNAAFAIHPKVTLAELKFLTVGDGEQGPSEGPAPDVEVTAKSSPYYKISSIAFSTANNVLVAGTEQPGAPFIVADDRASNWSAVPALGFPFTGYVERLHWIDEWQVFLGQCAFGSSYAVLSGSPDGMLWSAQLHGSVLKGRFSGFAFSPSLGRAVVASVGTGQNIRVYDGGGWYIGTTGDDGGYSIIWSAALNRFLGFKPGSQIIKQSMDGLTWSDYSFLIPVPCGSAAGVFAAYLIPLDTPGQERILLFTEGGTAPAFHSDNGGLNWTAVSGLENTGSVTRYVAVDGNAVYVAYNAELNKGMISLDRGSTWERSDHLSGNASGVIALQ